MCTHIVLKNKNNNIISARTMDFSLELEPSIVVFPRNYSMEFNNLSSPLKEHFAFLGLGKNIGQYIIADGVNEYGLSMAALYFEGCADFTDIPDENKTNLDSHEVLHWILANCKDISSVKNELEKINVLNNTLNFIGKPAPLHWVVVDQKGKSIIIEPLDKGFVISDNAVGVLTNSPDLSWHYTNLRNYIGLDNNQLSERKIGQLNFAPFGQGSGSFGLPGDYTPTSRFVRAVFNKLSCDFGESINDTLIAGINILNTVSIPRGSVVTQRNTIDYTQYSSYVDVINLDYYFKTYYTNQMQKVSLNSFDLDNNQLIIKNIKKELSVKEI